MAGDNIFSGSDVDIVGAIQDSVQPDVISDRDNTEVPLTADDGHVNEPINEPADAPDEPNEPITEPNEPAPEWASKFESADVMYSEYESMKKAYDNIRPEYTRTTQELSSMKKTLEQLQQGEISDVPEEQKQILDSVLSIVQQQVDGRINPIVEKQEALEMENIVADMTRTHEDFSEHSDEIREILKDNPFMWNGGKGKALEMAYTLAKGRQVESIVDDLVQKKLDALGKTNVTKKNIDKGSSRVGTPAVKTPKSAGENIADGIVGARGGSNTVFG